MSLSNEQPKKEDGPEWRDEGTLSKPHESSVASCMSMLESLKVLLKLFSSQHWTRRNGRKERKFSRIGLTSSTSPTSQNTLQTRLYSFDALYYYL